MMEQEFKEKISSWKDSYDGKVKAQFQKEMDSVVQNYEHKLSAVKNASKKEINELKECYNSLVKEQDMIIARDKVVVTFSILILQKNLEKYKIVEAQLSEKNELTQHLNAVIEEQKKRI